MAARLNDARAQLASHTPGTRFTDAQRVWRLVARPKPLGRPINGESGWGRDVLTARRTSGEQVTLYFHGKSRTFRVKVRPCTPAREQRPLVLDQIREVSGLVASCASCGRIYAKSDQRMRFCSTTRAARERQRRHRQASTARAAYEAYEVVKAQRIPLGPTSEYAAEERAIAAELAARKQQQRNRTK